MDVVSLCGTAGRNTGRVLCDRSRGVPTVLMPGGAVFTPTDFATQAGFQAAFLAKINLATGSGEKLYPFPEIQNVTNSTEANTEGTTGRGFKMVLRKGKPAYVFGVLAGSNLEKALLAFDGETMPVFIWDDKGALWGKEDIDGNFVGADALITVTPKPYSDGNSVETEYTQISVSFLSSEDVFQLAAFVQTSFSKSNLLGLIDATLAEASVSNTNARKISVKFINTELGGNVNLGEKYKVPLADVDMWTLVNAETGADVAKTSVAWDATLKAFTFTIDTTAYSALPAGKSLIANLAAPEVLAEGGVRGIEGLPVLLTKTA